MSQTKTEPEADGSPSARAEGVPEPVSSEPAADTQSTLTALRAEAAALSSQLAKQQERARRRRLAQEQKQEALGGEDAADDAASTARDLLARHKQIRAVHSTASLSSILQRSQARAPAQPERPVGDAYPVQIGSKLDHKVLTTVPAAPELVERPLPHLVDLGDRGDTGVWAKKTGPANPSHLPYLYRNPAV